MKVIFEKYHKIGKWGDCVTSFVVCSKRNTKNIRKFTALKTFRCLLKDIKQIIMP